MELAELDLTQLYTYADYIKWDFEERVELLRGKIFKMGAPSTTHQRISMQMGSSINAYLKGKHCEVFSAPFDVRIPRKTIEDKDIITVFQPDLCVICDPSKIDDRGCLGAPDIVIEILAPLNNKIKLKYKHQIYEEIGVKEYWIIDPRENCAMINILTNGKLIAHGYLFEEDKITSELLPGFSLDLGVLFDKI